MNGFSRRWLLTRFPLLAAAAANLPFQNRGASAPGELMIPLSKFPQTGTIVTVHLDGKRIAHTALPMLVKSGDRIMLDLAGRL